MCIIERKKSIPITRKKSSFITNLVLVMGKLFYFLLKKLPSISMVSKISFVLKISIG